jgi:hypothetical protein
MGYVTTCWTNKCWHVHVKDDRCGLVNYHHSQASKKKNLRVELGWKLTIYSRVLWASFYCYILLDEGLSPFTAF